MTCVRRKMCVYRFYPKTLGVVLIKSYTQRNSIFIVFGCVLYNECVCIICIYTKKDYTRAAAAATNDRMKRGDEGGSDDREFIPRKNLMHIQGKEIRILSLLEQSSFRIRAKTITFFRRFQIVTQFIKRHLHSVHVWLCDRVWLCVCVFIYISGSIKNQLIDKSSIGFQTLHTPLHTFLSSSNPLLHILSLASPFVNQLHSLTLSRGRKRSTSMLKQFSWGAFNCQINFLCCAQKWSFALIRARTHAHAVSMCDMVECYLSIYRQKTHTECTIGCWLIGGTIVASWCIEIRIGATAATEILRIIAQICGESCFIAGREKKNFITCWNISKEVKTYTYTHTQAQWSVCVCLHSEIERAREREREMFLI